MAKFRSRVVGERGPDPGTSSVAGVVAQVAQWISVVTRERRAWLAAMIAYLSAICKAQYGAPRITADMPALGWRVELLARQWASRRTSRSARRATSITRIQGEIPATKRLQFHGTASVNLRQRSVTR